MNQLVTLSHKLSEWKQTFPLSFKGLHLPESSVLSAAGKFGSICIQEYHSENFCFRLNVFDLIERMVIRSGCDKPGLFTRIILKGRVEHEINSSKKWSLSQNQFSVLRSKGLVMNETYEKNTHITFDTHCSMKFAKELLILHPSYTPPGTGRARFADIDTLELVNSILRCKYEKELFSYFVKSRIKDLLFKYLLLDQTYTNEDVEVAGKEINAINEAARIISSDVAHHYSIPALSKKVLLNEFRFKILFKKVFGIGPYEYLVRKRMEKGKQLLEAGLSIKEAAAEVGYRPSDFTTVFRNYFGVRPSSIKQKS